LRAAVFLVSLSTIIARKRETSPAQLTIWVLVAKSMELYDKSVLLRKKKRSQSVRICFLSSGLHANYAVYDSTLMKWLAFATDFDGTIATDAVVDEPTQLALVRLRSANVRRLLVTGRHLSDFEAMGSFLAIFDMVVAENGAVLFDPASDETRTLSPPPPEAFVAELSRRGVNPLGVGRSIVDTREPHQATVVEVIKELGLELQVIFNKGAVMVLPSGINKASGLQAALETFGLSATTVIGVGDAENDHAFLEMCGLPVAVANAVPALKEKAALVTQHSAGAGVVELIDSALRGDLDSHIRVDASQ
jgi:hydroxymethylpyrimidine pyrophosphatase-like HAD family hydrolase